MAPEGWGQIFKLWRGITHSLIYEEMDTEEYFI